MDIFSLEIHPNINITKKKNVIDKDKLNGLDDLLSPSVIDKWVSNAQKVWEKYENEILK